MKAFDQRNEIADKMEQSSMLIEPNMGATNATLKGTSKLQNYNGDNSVMTKDSMQNSIMKVPTAANNMMILNQN